MANESPNKTLTIAGTRRSVNGGENEKMGTNLRLKKKIAVAV